MQDKLYRKIAEFNFVFLNNISSKPLRKNVFKHRKEAIRHMVAVCLFFVLRANKHGCGLIQCEERKVRPRRFSDCFL